MTEPFERRDPENKYVFDPESEVELSRLLLVDRLLTRTMGGPLAGLPELPKGAQVVDLACGPGGWVLDVAFERPDIEAAGVDISERMIKFAASRAQAQELYNASFEVMNIRQPLQFSDASYDLVNARFITTVLLRDDWPVFLQECKRILKPGAILRLTELDLIALTNSPAHEYFSHRAGEAMRAMQHGFSPDGRTFGITPVLGNMMKRAGFIDLQRQGHIIDFSAGTEAWTEMYHNAELASFLGGMLAVNLNLATQEEVERMRAQLLQEIQSEDFGGVQFFFSFWGRKPA